MGKSDFDTVLTNPSMETGGNKSETVVARRSSATAGLGRTRKQRETEKFLERRRPYQHELLVAVAWDLVAASCSHRSLAMDVPDKFGGMREREAENLKIERRA